MRRFFDSTHLLHTRSKYSGNAHLFKKILMTAWKGRLRINDQPPDVHYSLADYLMDNENIIFDVKRLSHRQRVRFQQWLFAEHRNERKKVFWNAVTASEHRGFTSEAVLGLGGKLKRWFSRDSQYYWELDGNKLNGFTVCPGKDGFILSLDPSSECSEAESEGNVKRVYITESLIDQLVNEDLETMDLETIITNPHPQSVHVVDYEKRHNLMKEYRNFYQFIEVGWFNSLCQWIVSWFIDTSSKTYKKPVSFEPFCEIENLSIHRDVSSGEIMVVEPKPNLDSLVLSGGGIKLCCHVGVLKAFHDAGIKFDRMAGSSAGAIVNLSNYLGYSPDKLMQFLNNLRKDNIIFYEMNRKGFSHNRALKGVIDVLIANKIDELVDKYHIPYPEGPITFAVLNRIKEQCPNCGFGDELILTATNIPGSKVRFFSLERTPDVEVSAVVTASASYPVLFQPYILDGEEHNDGAILCNLPTEMFRDDYSTFLELGQENYAKLLIVLLGNDLERNILDKMSERIYRENWFVNWIYSIFTRVDDPVSAFEEDRKKLRQHALQTILVNTQEVGTTDFDLSQEGRQILFDKGYTAGCEYIQSRYVNTDRGIENDEGMYATFTSLSELLSWCCYRNNLKIFEALVKIIRNSRLEEKDALLEQADALREIYFKISDKKSQDHGFFSGKIEILPKAANDPGRNGPAITYGMNRIMR